MDFGGGGQCNSKPYRNFGFTLAEVLITLGIIGVVASLTLPVIVQKYINSVVENRLKNFYTITNQAILMAEEKYGDRKHWFAGVSDGGLDENGNLTGGADMLDWYKKYFDPYIKSVNIIVNDVGVPTIYLSDGSAFTAAVRNWIFYTTNPDKCIKRFGNIANAGGKCAFYFNFSPEQTYIGWEYLRNKGVEPFKFAWHGNEKLLYSGSLYSCKNTGYSKIGTYCTAIIQLNGWKIPDDYPLKVYY